MSTILRFDFDLARYGLGHWLGPFKGHHFGSLNFIQGELYAPLVPSCEALKQSAFSRIGRLVCAKSPTPLEPPRGIEGSLKRPDGHRAGGPLLGRYSFIIPAASAQCQWDSAESQPLRFTGWWFARKSEGGTHPWLNIKKRSVPTRTNVVRTAERVVDTYLCTFYFPKLQKTRNVQ